MIVTRQVYPYFRRSPKTCPPDQAGKCLSPGIPFVGIIHRAGPCSLSSLQPSLCKEGCSVFKNPTSRLPFQSEYFYTPSPHKIIHSTPL
jgi:hypothetical protein